MVKNPVNFTSRLTKGETVAALAYLPVHLWLLPLLLHQLGIGFIPQFFAAEALAAGDLVAIPLQCDWPRRQIYLLEDTARPLNRWAEPLRQLLLESAQA